MLSKMDLSTPSLAFVALLLCFSFFVNPQLHNYPTASAPASWTNSPSLPLNYEGETIRSLLLRLNVTHGMSFATGFYCFPPCKSFFLSIYIVHTYIDNYGSWHDGYSQVIWSANRAHPVSENATVELTSKDGLILRDSDGNLVWSTNVMNRSVAGINITEAGNLVLFDINNSKIWQSFDHPTDCLVRGQTLAGDMRIIANSTSTDLAESQFYLTLLADVLYGYVNSNPPLVYYHYPNFYDIGDKSVSMKFMNGSLTMFSTLSNTDNDTLIFALPPSKSIQYMRLEYDGHLRLYDYDDLQGWKMVADLFSMDSSFFDYMDKCDYPTICGPYGICDNGQCYCPLGALENFFKQVHNRQGELGCYAVTNITCQDVNTHLMLALNNVSYFNHEIDNVVINGKATDEETCKSACLGDYKCKAALYQVANGNSSDGLCLTLQEVFSFKNEPNAHSSVYIKVQVAPSPSNSNVGLGAILGSTFGALFFILTLISMYIVCLRIRKEPQDDDIIEQLLGMPTRFTFEELRAATENFVKILGKDGFGTVFEGRWGDDRIAVKLLDNVGYGKKDFLTEVETISSIHHINLVRMIGFCANKLNRLLVYEYMCNGSLDQWIYCKDGRVPLDWPTRFKIITDIAKGLCYLHEDCRQKIVHFDIKPENILLDEKFNAKVSDFGLSKLIDRDISRVMTKMRGTSGYLAPEWLTAMVTEKVDVYSFGVVVMEVLSGRRNLDDSLTEENRHLIKLLEEKSKSIRLSDLIDKNLSDVELYKNEIMNVIELAIWCLQWDSTRRPSMLKVVKVLEGVMEVETSFDYNFVSSISMIANIPGIVDQSAPFPASMLSGPR